MANHLPVDHPLSRLYRAAGALIGVVLVVFGVLAYVANRDDVVGTVGKDVVGLHGNGLLGIIVALLGLLCLAGALLGGNKASSGNLVTGVVLILVGSVGLCIIRTPSANIIGVHVRTVVAMYVLGIVAAACGLYGRTDGGKSQSANAAASH